MKDKNNLTHTFYCDVCDQKFKEHKIVSEKKQRLCTFCYNYEKKSIKNITKAFIISIFIVGLTEFINSFITSKILDFIVVCGYLILTPTFLFFIILIYNKKIVTR